MKRDILRRSSIGVIATHRNNSFEYDGSNSLYGADAAFTFFENLNINTYYARSLTDGYEGQDDSYLAQVNYGSDRYGFSASHLKIGDDFSVRKNLDRLELGEIDGGGIRQEEGHFQICLIEKERHPLLEEGKVDKIVALQVGPILPELD